MINHINIDRESSVKGNNQYFSGGRFSRSPMVPQYGNKGANHHKKPNPIIYDWQLMDYEPEKTSREPGGFYVADWQIFTQD